MIFDPIQSLPLARNGDAYLPEIKVGKGTTLYLGYPLKLQSEFYGIDVFSTSLSDYFTYKTKDLDSSGTRYFDLTFRDKFLVVKLKKYDSTLKTLYKWEVDYSDLQNYIYYDFPEYVNGLRQTRPALKQKLIYANG